MATRFGEIPTLLPNPPTIAAGVRGNERGSSPAVSVGLRRNVQRS